MQSVIVGRDVIFVLLEDGHDIGTHLSRLGGLWKEHPVDHSASASILFSRL